jgi:hypothetical protein
MTLHPGEPHGAGLSGRLNWLRAGVLGANDGIVSVAGIVVGVAGARVWRRDDPTAGRLTLRFEGAGSASAGPPLSLSSRFPPSGSGNDQWTAAIHVPQLRPKNGARFGSVFPLAYCPAIQMRPRPSNEVAS